MLVDEVAWRVENVGLDDRRKSLIEAFDFKEYENEEQCGIGGGYGQFGILTEEEFLRLVKAPGKRVQEFTEFWGQHKEAIHVRPFKRHLGAPLCTFCSWPVPATFYSLPSHNMLCSLHVLPMPVARAFRLRALASSIV